MNPDPNKHQEERKVLVKSILQKLEQGDGYQRANDLLDNIVTLYARTGESDALGPLETLVELAKELPFLSESRRFTERLYSVEEGFGSEIPQEQKLSLIRDLENVRLFPSQPYRHLWK